MPRTSFYFHFFKKGIILCFLRRTNLLYRILTAQITAPYGISSIQIKKIKVKNGETKYYGKKKKKTNICRDQIKFKTQQMKVFIQAEKKNQVFQAWVWIISCV